MQSLQPLPAFQDNYIWTLSNEAGKFLIVDPGEAAPVLRAAAEGREPVAILLTHHHRDHIGGVEALLSRFDIPCFAPADARIDCPVQPVGDGDFVDVGELGARFEVFHIPGHTLSHIGFHGGGLLFCGDTLFSMGCGRLFEGTPAQMLSSLDRLAALPGDTLVCCGHEYTQANGRFASQAEPENRIRDARLEEVEALRRQGLPSLPSTMASELACNPFLRLDQVAIPGASRGAEQLGRVETFAALRTWKDGFNG